jgi:hypothetical protein
MAISTLEQYLDLVTGFWRTGIVRAAIELHVGDHIAKGRTSAETIAAAERADLRGVRILLDALCGLGVMVKREDAYDLTPPFRNLGTAAAGTPTWASADSWTMWGDLSRIVRRGSPSQQGINYGRDFAVMSRPMALQKGARAASQMGVANGDALKVLDLGFVHRRGDAHLATSLRLPAAPPDKKRSAF